MKKAIVLGCRNIGLGVIRALASKNIDVMAIPDKGFDFAHFSRFVTVKTERMSPDEEGTKLHDFLLNLEKDWDGSLILSTSDPFSIYLSKNRKALSSRYIPAIQEWDTIHKILNKALLYQHAQKTGVPIPAVLFPDTIEGLTQIRHELTYPCILKPYLVHDFFSVYKTKLMVIKNFDELIEKFKIIQDNNLQVMVSEIIPGGDDHIYNYLSYIDIDGDLSAEVCMQKIRQHPPIFGMARVAKTIPMIQEIRNLSLQLLKHFSYHGLSSVEFKFDPRDNRYKLMEINIRSELQERLFFAAGINFPNITYLDYAGGLKQAPPAYETGIYWIDIFTDLYEFIKSRKIENYSWRDYLHPYFQKKVFSVPFFDDPLPFIAKTLILLRQNLKR